MAEYYFHPRIKPFSVITNEYCGRKYVGSVLTIPTYPGPIEKIPIQRQGSIIQLLDSGDFYSSSGIKWDKFFADGAEFTITSDPGNSIIGGGVGPNFTMKSLIGVNIGLTTGAGTGITVSNAGIAEFNSDLTGVSLLTSSSTTSDVVLRRLTSDTSSVLITPSGPDELDVTINPNTTTIATTVSTQTPIIPLSIPFIDNDVNPNITIKSLASSDTCTIVDGGSYAQFNVVFGPDPPTTTLTSLGGTSLIDNGIGPDLTILGLSAGPNIQLTASPSDISIAYDAGPITGTVTSIIAGSGITISPASGTGDVTVSTLGDGTGFIAYLNVLVSSFPGDTDIITNSGTWTVSGGGATMFNSGRTIIPGDGIYAINWGMVTGDTGTITYLCINGVCYQSRNSITSSSNASSNCVSYMRLALNDVITLRNNQTTNIAPLSRGAGGQQNATYISVQAIGTIPSSTSSNPRGVFAGLNTLQSSYPADEDVVTPDWTTQYSTGGIFSNGRLNIQDTGLYYITWSMVQNMTGNITYMCINGKTVQSQNAIDNASNCQNLAAGTFYLFTGDVISLRINVSGNIRVESRGASGNAYATYISAYKIM